MVELKQMASSQVGGFGQKSIVLPGGESNPGLPRDRRGYSPLYYRGLLVTVAAKKSTCFLVVLGASSSLRLPLLAGAKKARQK